MALLANFQEPVQSGDRRGSTRRSLHLNVENHRVDNGAGQVIVHDLSLTGVLLETSAPLATGETFEVDLPEAGMVEASVVWNSGEYYGCLFKRPISTTALCAAVLRGSPRTPEPPAIPSIVELIAELRSINEQVVGISSKVGEAVDRLAANEDGA
jgi:Tat protein secretion system quality control protein TatD with DNase activity